MDELHGVYALLKSRPTKIILFGDISNRKSDSHSIQQFVEKYCLSGEKIIELTTQFRCREQIAELCNYLLHKNGGESVETHSSVKERNTHLNSDILAPVSAVVYSDDEEETINRFIHKFGHHFGHKRRVAVVCGARQERGEADIVLVSIRGVEDRSLGRSLSRAKDHVVLFGRESDFENNFDSYILSKFAASVCI
jgi:hypothetical protein